jgi:hypothetical protein
LHVLPLALSRSVASRMGAIESVSACAAERSAAKTSRECGTRKGILGDPGCRWRRAVESESHAHASLPRLRYAD